MIRNPKRGIASLFVASIFYGLYGILSRLISDSFGNFNQAWIRNILVAILIAFIIGMKGVKLVSIKRKDIRWLLVWLLAGSLPAVLTFIVFNNLAIGTTYLIAYSGMIAAGFISGRIFFDERLDTRKWVSLICTLIGLYIVYRFTIDQNKIVYMLLGLLSGAMTGVWNTISKKFSDNYPNNQLVLMDALTSTLAAYIGALLFHEYLPHTILSISWIWIGIYAVIQTINVGLIVYGFKHIEAQIGSIILPIEIVFATIFSYLIFGEVPTLFTFVGGALIILGAILPSLNIFAKE
ncbi:MAG: DMT family transporter [Candidatus Roizmanbacteria bacterium]|nr:DMT family transporter [Candidatus Roizmanbacteria bacterium]